MADYLSKTTIVTILIVAQLFLPPLAGSVPSQELDRALSALRYRGHALFANAIATSDLLFELLMVESVTLLCPTDSVLFALDMTQTLPFYIATLRLSAIPRRLTLSDLRSLSNASLIPTLVPSHSLLVTRPSSDPSAAVDLDGVRLLIPDMYTSRNIAVHVVAAVIPFRYAVTASSSPPPVSQAPVSPITGTVSLPVSVPGGSNSSKPSPKVTVTPSSPVTLPSQAPAINHANLLPPREASYPRVPAPAPVPWSFHGRPPTGSPMISPETAPATDYRNPPKMAEFSLVQLALLLGMDGAKGEPKSDQLVMETSEF